MKRFSLPLYVLLAAAPAFTACSGDDADAVADTARLSVSTAPTVKSATPDFPANDGAKKLSTDPVLALYELTKGMDVQRALTLGPTGITDAQFAEIKDFVDKNLKKKTPEATYKAIFAWVTKNLTYANGGDCWLDAYDVFIHRRCICQGYANLLKVMCLTQGIPAFIANGQLVGAGAHAWNYVYLSGSKTGKWMVSDPTNGRDYKMASTSDYRQRLVPQMADAVFYEDDRFTYDYYDNGLNVAAVKAGTADLVTVPFSVGGFRVTSFVPHTALPAGVRRLCLGSNITSLGLDDNPLARLTPGVEEVFVDPANTTFEVADNVLYRRGDRTPTYIPTATRRVVLRAADAIGKNTVTDLPYLEEIVFADGTAVIADYAVENCPSLRRAIVPASVTTIGPNAFYRCGDNVEIVRVATGIRHVTM